jgi:putative ABC transport system permease protein
MSRTGPESLNTEGIQMTVLVGALTIGLILALLALGVFISFRVFAFPDITADGSITLGACVTASLVVCRHTEPTLATLAGFLCGLLAGAATGILHTRFKIQGLLAGILVMTALYSINLHILGRSNQPFQEQTTLATYAEWLGQALLGGGASVNVLGWSVPARDLSMLLLALAVTVLVGAALYLFFRTNLGTAMRATGDNPQMIRSLGVNTGNMMIAGLALSNGLIALAGSLFAQYQGFADVQMGIGMVVWGLASVIIGEALVGSGHLGLTIAGAVMGSILFRQLVAIALRAGLNPTDLKLITSLFVFVALVLPMLLSRLKDYAKKRRLVLVSSPSERGAGGRGE